MNSNLDSLKKLQSLIKISRDGDMYTVYIMGTKLAEFYDDVPLNIFLNAMGMKDYDE